MRVLPLLLLLTLGATPLFGEEPPAEPLAWPHEGFAAISEAADVAKPGGKRVLLGLSGGPT